MRKCDYVHVPHARYVCVVCVCVCVCVCCIPPRGRHGNILLAYLYVPNGVLTLTEWRRPGGVRDPLFWSCKPAVTTHHAYTCIIQAEEGMAWGSVLWPKFQGY